MSGGGSELGHFNPSPGRFVELNLAFTQVNKPVIAKIRRYALAGGLGLVCACHFAFAEDNATFGTPEIQRGLWPMMIMANIFRVVPRRKGSRVHYVWRENVGGRRARHRPHQPCGLIGGPGRCGSSICTYPGGPTTARDETRPGGVLPTVRYGLRPGTPYLNEMLMKCLTLRMPKRASWHS